MFAFTPGDVILDFFFQPCRVKKKKMRVTVCYIATRATIRVIKADDKDTKTLWTWLFSLHLLLCYLWTWKGTQVFVSPAVALLYNLWSVFCSCCYSCKSLWQRHTKACKRAFLVDCFLNVNRVFLQFISRSLRWRIDVGLTSRPGLYIIVSLLPKATCPPKSSPLAFFLTQCCFWSKLYNPPWPR